MPAYDEALSKFCNVWMNWPDGISGDNGLRDVKQRVKEKNERHFALSFYTIISIICNVLLSFSHSNSKQQRENIEKIFNAFCHCRFCERTLVGKSGSNANMDVKMYMGVEDLPSFKTGNFLVFLLYLNFL